MNAQEQLKQKLLAKRSGISQGMFPDGFTLDEYQKQVEKILIGQKTTRQSEIFGKWAEGNGQTAANNVRIDKSILRNQKKERKISEARVDRLATNKPLLPKHVKGLTEGELLHRYDVSELVTLYEKSDDLTDLAKLHGNQVMVGSEGLKGALSKKIITSPEWMKKAGAFGVGLTATNLVNNLLFEEPLPTPIVLLEAAGVSYVGYKAAMPALAKQAENYTRKTYLAEKTERALQAKAKSPQAFQKLMKQSENIAGERLAKRQIQNIHRTTSVAKGAGLFIAGTALLDMANRAMNKAEEKHQIASQEKDIRNKQKEEKDRRERYRSGTSFGAVDTSTIVMDLFNERIGHHKMGNSKF